MRKISILLFLFLLIQTAYSQILFRTYPNYTVSEGKIKELESSDIRKVILLNGVWTVFAEGEKEQSRAAVSVPSVYSGDDELYFEKKITFTAEQIEKYSYRLDFLGLSYAADISLNGSVIYRHTGGWYPFSVFLPKTTLKPGKDQNTLLVHLFPLGTELNTIPSRYQFLSPAMHQGIFRDVYLTEMSDIAINHYSVHQESVTPGRAKIRLEINLIARTNAKTDSLLRSTSDIDVKLSIAPKSGTQTPSTSLLAIEMKAGKEKDVQMEMDLLNPILWSPDAPAQYRLKLEIDRGGVIIDRIERDIALYSMKVNSDSIRLNGASFHLQGVTYVPVYKDYGGMMSYEQMRHDILMIKEVGFNAIRFLKTAPHPYLLQLCQEFGLLAFVDIPLERVPSSKLSDADFLSISKTYYSQWIEYYNNYSAVAAVGLGSMFAINDENDNYFLTQMIDIVKQRSRKLIYAVFLPSNQPTEIKGIDIYGLEALNRDIKWIGSARTPWDENFGSGRVLLLSAGMLVTEGASNGYVNPYTNEAQAKFFSDIWENESALAPSGFFLHTMFDYSSEYRSIVGMLASEHTIPIGLFDQNRSNERTAAKVLSAYLHNQQKLSVPVGVRKDKAPFEFILFGLLFALIIFSLLNSGKKFREHTMRALVRPYNFFADIRDLPQTSLTQTILLAVIVGAITSLMTSSFFHYLRHNDFFEKLLLTFGSSSLMSGISYLAWHPTHSLILLTLAFFFLLCLIALIFRIAAITVVTRVSYRSLFHVVVWACIPVLLLTPPAIILYRILVPEVANWPIYALSLLFGVWLYFRILKGAHVIFDTSLRRVYFFGIFGALLAGGIVMAYFQMHYNTLDFIGQVIREHKAGM